MFLILLFLMALVQAEECFTERIEQWSTEPMSAWEKNGQILVLTSIRSDSTIASSSITLAENAIGTVNVSVLCNTSIWPVFDIYVIWDGDSNEIHRLQLWTTFTATSGKHTIQLQIDSSSYPNGELLISDVSISCCTEKPAWKGWPAITFAIVMCVFIIAMVLCGGGFCPECPSCKRKNLPIEKIDMPNLSSV